VAFAAGLAIFAVPAAAASDPADFYAGKRITVIVAGSAGAGYDVLARLATRHLDKHIPGNPTFVVQNMRAAGGLAAANHLYTIAEKDGTVIGALQRGILVAKMANASGTRFDVEKFSWIGNFTSETGLIVGWHTAPVKTAEEARKQEMIVGGITGTDPEMVPRLYNALLGTKFKIVTGYTGMPDASLAMERGEIHSIGDWSWSSLKAQKPEWLRDKKVNLLFQAALRKHPELPDVPLALDLVKDAGDRQVLELLLAQKEVARPLVAPPDVPAPQMAILRKAFMAMADDPDFRDDAAKSKLDVSLTSGEAVERIVAGIAATPPDIAERFVKITSVSEK
jgi:tripartite-type tricarboxylate transporter receptor subunit TctC